MSERRRNEPRRARKRIDPYNYAMYLPDDESTEAIEYRFKQLDDLMKRNNGANPEDAAREVFKLNATPQQIPVEVWFDLENEIDANDNDEDASFIPGFDEGDDFVPRHHLSSSRARRSPKTKTSLIAASQQIEHLGAGVDLWPLYKVQQLDVPPMINNIHDYPNRETFHTRNKVASTIKGNPIHIVDRITARVIHQIVGEYCDAIIMDPPFGYNDWTKERFQKLLLNLYNYLQRCFIVIWADPENLELIQEVFEKSEYVFCDSIAIELLDPSGGPYFLPPDGYGFKRESRMAIMFRTDDINRSDLKQQRVKDTGFGTVYENGKSYGRIGLPLSIHEILEIMLPDLPNRKRTFVELWPSYFTRRNGWINIDEKVNLFEEVRDEIVQQETTSLESVQFDDTLINRLIDVDDGKPVREIEVSDEDLDSKPIIIENGTDDRDDDIDVTEIVKRKEQKTTSSGGFVDDEIIYSSDSSDDSDD